MSEQELLLQNILDVPADDVARLVYADWLEENGEPGYAHFIRRGVADPQPWKLCGRPLPTALFFEKRTVAVPEELCQHATYTVTRGFVYRIDITCAAFMARAADLFAAHPVTEVVLTDKRPYLDNPPGVAGAYMWFRQDSADPRERAAHLPPPLFDVVAAATSGELRDVGVALAAVTLDEVLAALSDACVAYGRAKAAERRAVAA